LLPPHQLKGLGRAVSSPSGIWDVTPAEIEFGAFLILKNLASCDRISVIFVRTY